MGSLKRCKCGSKKAIMSQDVFTRKFFCVCLDCGNRVQQMDTARDAIAAWNNEPEPEEKKPKFYRCTTL